MPPVALSRFAELYGLQSTLEDWLLLGLQLGHKLLVIAGINLNRKASTREPAHAKAH